jgi:hypothetical protein
VCEFGRQFAVAVVRREKERYAGLCGFLFANIPQPLSEAVPSYIVESERPSSELVVVVAILPSPELFFLLAVSDEILPSLLLH